MKKNETRALSKQGTYMFGAYKTANLIKNSFVFSKDLPREQKGKKRRNLVVSPSFPTMAGMIFDIFPKHKKNRQHFCPET